ncbi:MAG: D-2-hydroxyacid dehydrogenase [Gammaproteobacteria bacterium]|nr:D-2-hydroxyacid dehydrogenase [Gammaproteobacteria bacterium]
MATFAFLPPLDDEQRDWAKRLAVDCPNLEVRVIEQEIELPQALGNIEAAYGWVPPTALPFARNLKWLQNPMAGPPPSYYYPELVQHQVVVTNPRGIYSDHIAHHILMYMLALSRGLPYYMDAQRRGRWDKRARQRGYVDISESKVLINGVGGIGAETGRLCVAMGADVIGIDSRNEFGAEFDIHPPDSLDTWLPQADFIVTTVPHTPDTEFMWDRARFQAMKSTAYFINIGRGMTVKLDDLVVALEEEELAGAGLDVFEVEPLPVGHALWQCENVIITPHVAVANALNISERRYELLLDNARRFVANEPLRNVVDKALRY